jgi:acetylglutamate synthase
MSPNNQSANFNHVTARDITVKQSIVTGSGISEPLSKDEFISTVHKLINELQRVSDQHPEIGDAILELESVIQETQRAKPEPSAIKRFLNTARGALMDVAESVTAIGTINTAITMLIGTIRTIFDR